MVVTELFQWIIKRRTRARQVGRRAEVVVQVIITSSPHPSSSYTLSFPLTIFGPYSLNDSSSVRARGGGNPNRYITIILAPSNNAKYRHPGMDPNGGIATQRYSVHDGNNGSCLRQYIVHTKGNSQGIVAGER